MMKGILGDKMNNNLLLLQSDFCLADDAVSSMIGVPLEESPILLLASLFLIACYYLSCRIADDFIAFRNSLKKLKKSSHFY